MLIANTRLRGETQAPSTGEQLTLASQTYSSRFARSSSTSSARRYAGDLPQSARRSDHSSGPPVRGLLQEQSLPVAAVTTETWGGVSNNHAGTSNHGVDIAAQHALLTADSSAALLTDQPLSPHTSFLDRGAPQISRSGHSVFQQVGQGHTPAEAEAGTSIHPYLPDQGTPYTFDLFAGFGSSRGSHDSIGDPSGRARNGGWAPGSGSLLQSTPESAEASTSLPSQRPIVESNAPFTDIIPWDTTARILQGYRDHL